MTYNALYIHEFRQLCLMLWKKGFNVPRGALFICMKEKCPCIYLRTVHPKLSTFYMLLLITKWWSSSNFFLFLFLFFTHGVSVFFFIYMYELNVPLVFLASLLNISTIFTLTVQELRLLKYWKIVFQVVPMLLLMNSNQCFF